jgi:hypothetical protein
MFPWNLCSLGDLIRLTRGAKNSSGHLVPPPGQPDPADRDTHVPNATLFLGRFACQYSKVPEFATNILSRPRPLMPNAPAARDRGAASKKPERRAASATGLVRHLFASQTPKQPETTGSNR